MKAEDIIKKWKRNPKYHMTAEETKALGREELLRFFEMFLEFPEGRKQTVEWLMKQYEPYFTLED